MSGIACPKCGSRDTMYKKKKDYEERDFSCGFSDNKSQAAAKEILETILKAIEFVIDNNTKYLYCRSCGFFGKM